jgi:hypothetical protein
VTQSYLNRWGVRYYLPDFGPPVRWVASVPDFDRPELPVLLYYECDAENLGMRAIHIHADGRTTLAFPGGPDGDMLPEGPLATVEQYNALNGGRTREISEIEFNSIWAALSQAKPETVAPSPILDLTSSTEQAAYKPFVGTWSPAEDITGLPPFLLFSLNGVVFSKSENNEIDLFRYHVENGVAKAESFDSTAEYEIVNGHLSMRISGHEVGLFTRVE